MLAAQEAGVDGAVSTHTHRSDISAREGIRYCNGGDWLGSWTAVVEDEIGQLSPIDWPELRLAEAVSILQAA